MKKIIEELEDLVRNIDNCVASGYKGTEGEREGLVKALSIIKSHDPWIDVSEQLPPRQESKVYSIEVNVTDGNTVRLAMYDYELNRWFIRGYIAAAAYFIPIKWAYLPEVKP